MLGDKIRKIRISKKMSQNEFADLAGINEKYYGKIERNESQPTVAILVKILNALEINAIGFSLFDAEEKDCLLSNLKICKILSESYINSFDIHFNKDTFLKGCEKSIWYNGYIGSLSFDEFEMKIYAEGNIKAKLYKDYKLVLELNDESVSNDLMKYIKTDEELYKIINYSEYDEEWLNKQSGNALFIYESNWLTAEIVNNKTFEVVGTEIIFDTDNILECFIDKNLFFDYVFKQKKD